MQEGHPMATPIHALPPEPQPEVPSPVSPEARARARRAAEKMLNDALASDLRLQNAFQWYLLTDRRGP
jgi:hypothetical protein